MITTSHAVAQYFSCPRKAYFLHKEGCVTPTMASFLRERLRMVSEFSFFPEMKNADPIASHDDISKGAKNTYDTCKRHEEENRKDGAISHAVFSSDDLLYAYVPLCRWNGHDGNWDLHFCAVANGLRSEHKIHAACALYVCEMLAIPIGNIWLHLLVSSEEGRHRGDDGVIAWRKWDITIRSIRHLQGIRNDLDAFLRFLRTDEAKNEEGWKQCTRQYCDVCAIEKHYGTNDVRTLRETQTVIRDLMRQGITTISTIPPSMELRSSTKRQIEAIRENRTIFFRNEVGDFLSQLDYPRVYLDFEAFSTSVPFFPDIGPNDFVPFLFSVQWQDAKDAAIHTRIWAMPYGSDRRKEMWKELFHLLSRSGCIVVYNSNFEIEMIRQISALSGEAHKGEFLVTKIIDLQKIFMDLSLYNPEQKGKIALKTITSIWIDGDYTMFKVSAGVQANYFYIVLSDKKKETFANIQSSSYLKELCEKIEYFDKKYDDIGIRDIAAYCKYDTEVMIRIVALLERMYKNNDGEE